jgi:hypothetical protein
VLSLTVLVYLFVLAMLLVSVLVVSYLCPVVQAQLAVRFSSAVVLALLELVVL